MSEHVCDHFEMENPLNLATINTKNGRQNPAKIAICSTDKRRVNSFFVATTYWKKMGYKVMSVWGCNTKRENTLNFPKSYNAKFLYLGRFKCNKHSFSNLSDYILKRQWNYFISAESDFYQLLCVLVFDFQNRNYDLIVMNLAEICRQQFLSSWV